MITNKTKNRKIIEKTRMCTSTLCKGLGLMFRKKPDYGLVFVFDSEKKLGRTLTMMFVFYPIDVLFLDSKMKVVDKIDSFRPWTNYTPKRPSKYVIELPEGAAKGTSVGDAISVSGL